MTHRIREAMKAPKSGKFGGGGKIVEADETYYGTEDGRRKSAQRDKYGKRAAGRAAFNAMNKIVSTDTDRKFHSIRGASSVLLSRERRCFMTDLICPVVLWGHSGCTQSAL